MSKPSEKLTLSRETILPVSLGMLITLVVATMWVQAEYSNLQHEHVEFARDIATVQVTASANTEAIDRINYTLKISAIDRELDSNRRELRGLQRDLDKDQTNKVVIDQIRTVREGITRLEERRECYLNKETTICE